MSNTLIFIQHRDGQIEKASLSALNAASQLGHPVSAVVVGSKAKDVATQLSAHSLGKIYAATDARYDQPIARDLANLVLQLQADNGFSHVVVASTTIGKDFAPIVAAKLNAGQASDIVAVNSDNSFRRPIYAGNAFADVSLSTEVKVITVRASSFVAVEAASGSAEILEVSPNHEAVNNLTVISLEETKQDRPALGDAEVVVSGGRALGSKEKFEEVLYPLADKLNAAIGASRAAVDSGYAPNDWQVGQTGKIVSPKLYFAIGLSGAIQHLAGMKDSKTIVAINKDPEAPIFEVADYGIVADLFDVVPELVGKL